MKGPRNHMQMVSFKVKSPEDKFTLRENFKFVEAMHLVV
jgi:hypothetical protein